MKNLITFGIIVVLLVPLPARAWSKTGHRVVAELAERILAKNSPATLKKARKILNDLSMADVANWADEIQDGQSKYSVIFLHQWHFLNIPDGYTLKNVPRRPAGDSLKAMNLTEKILSGKKKLKTQSPNEDIEAWLKFYVHIVADMQQPLHVSRPGLDYYEQCNLPKPGPEVPVDKGGNDLKLTFFSQPSNLHRVWDQDLIASTNLSYTELSDELYRVFQKMDPDQIEDIGKASPAVWVKEALQMRMAIYNDLSLDPPTSDGLPVISYKYARKYENVVKGRLLFGGIRLAYRLNRILNVH